jgi:hypothetical protein
MPGPVSMTEAGSTGQASDRTVIMFSRLGRQPGWILDGLMALSSG